MTHSKSVQSEHLQSVITTAEPIPGSDWRSLEIQCDETTAAVNRFLQSLPDGGDSLTPENGAPVRGDWLAPDDWRAAYRSRDRGSQFFRLRVPACCRHLLDPTKFPESMRSEVAGITQALGDLFYRRKLVRDLTKTQRRATEVGEWLGL